MSSVAAHLQSTMDRYDSYETDPEADTSVLYEGELSDESNEQEEEDEIYGTTGNRRKRTLLLTSLCCLVVVVVLAIVLPVTLTTRNNNNNADKSINMAAVDGESLGLDGITEEGSYQKAAFDWLENDVESNGKTLTDEQLIQRYAVATVYFATNGAGWTSSEGWISSVPECEWEGVTCTPAVEGTVTQLALANKGLSGPMPKEISLLTGLQLLDFGGNSELGGPVPMEFGSLSQLAFLDLAECSLEGPLPSTLGSLVGLQQLLLNGNRGITGPVPSEFGGLQSIYMLKLHDTDLIGSMPQEVCFLFEQGSMMVPKSLEADCLKLRCACCTDCHGMPEEGIFEQRASGP